MYKPCSIDASLVVRLYITFMGVKNEENCGSNLLFTSWCINLANLIRLTLSKKPIAIPNFKFRLSMRLELLYTKDKKTRKKKNLRVGLKLHFQETR